MAKKRLIELTMAIMADARIRRDRHPMQSIRSAVAFGTAAALAAGALAIGVPAAAVAAPLSIDEAKVLDLSFDGNLSDAGPTAASVTMQKGGEAYGAGIDGEAFDFDGTNAVRLGTDAALQPADLTVSFWYKPHGAMTGEQVFAWSKLAYNSAGWYLTSESDASPLVLSVGPATGQPYKVAVDTARAGFFPAGQWTHVVVTFDKATKKVDFYRNGVRQVATVKNPATGTATGVIESESTTVKTLGYNGPLYDGAHVRGLLDDYELYRAVATIDDVVELTKRNDPSFAPEAVALAALEALSIPSSATTAFQLPTETANGTHVDWSSSHPDIISVDDGLAAVTRPESAAAAVTLTATAAYGGSEPVSKTFEITVPRSGASTSISLEETELSEVLLADPYLVNSNQKMIEYLLSLDPERFLYAFATEAGLPTSAEPYGGWERTSGTRFQGHFFGHYISALSQAYATTTDEPTKAALLAKLTTAVDGLDRAQDAYAVKDPANAGYVSPFSVSLLPSGGSGLLVPFYNLHKVLAGLLDAHQQAPAEVSAKALEVADGFGTWVHDWAGRQANPASILNTEYGGMNEALYELYSITEDPVHKGAAEYFDEVSLFEQLAAGNDVLNGKHANTTIPKLIGALKRYTVFTENPDLFETLTEAERAKLGMYRDAAENFWQMVVDDHSYANGGNSHSEHFHEPGTLYEHATNGTTSGYGENSTSEGCNEYNMLKLSRALFQVDPDVKYADFYESTYINTILASQNPETGMMTYFQPMTAGYAKVFGRPFDEFWCDHGTATESFTKLGDSFYFTKDRAVYVNQFRSSELTSSEHNLRLVQVADVPADDTVTITVEALDGGALADGTSLRLRIPNWVAETPTLTVNGETSDVASLQSDGYIDLPVAAGDEITYVLTAEVVVDDDTENPNWVAFKYGPVLLATELNRTNVDATYVAGVLVRMSVADKSVSNSVVVDDAVSWKADIGANLVRVADGENANGLETMRFKLQGADPASAALTFEPYYSLYGARYAIYMNLTEPDSEEAQQLILKGKEQLRIAETTIDSLTSFDNNNSEADKNYAYNKSSVGVHLGEGYRDGQRAADAYFQYEMIVDPAATENFLGARYFGGDNGRTFDVFVNDVLLKHERITGAAGASSWYVQYDRIPASVLAGIPAADSYKRDQNGEYVLDDDGERIPVVTVRFQGNGTSYVGGVYGVYTTTKTTYGTDADLTKLSFTDGQLSPQLTDDTYAYIATVPADATTATFDADPAVPSGLVYADDVLIDDMLPRTIALAEGDEPTVLTLRSAAQDHTTTVTYRIEIVRADVATLDVSAVAAVRCVAGRAVVTTTVSNADDVTVDFAVDGQFGSRNVTALAAGKSSSQAFMTRLASIDAGSVSVAAGATVDGAPVTRTLTVEYPAVTCD
ncbi:beta-L-arabinofuranosidase domain-containing protein [Agromyces laixinhei]|uniref:beta-L-arabinofuranosidase domain-containing protein n=1 Tax=Agromyces laixinhei TaxID=2585717 RepID=UPI0012EDBDD1|nr:beta-L-arabinofuranosidase domain-containing protein [Agromyces laixinhei]